MTQNHRGFLNLAAASALVILSLAPAAALAQTSSKPDQWIHVRVESKDHKGEMVRVNVPIDMAEKVLPTIHNENLRNGKIHIDSAHMNDIDLHALLDAIRTSKDGEYVTVQSNENDVRVAKNAGYLYVHVTDKGAGKNAAKEGGKESAKEARVEVKVPMKVVDALFSAGKDELDVVAALHALSSHGDLELVTVKDSENVVRVWIDSKNSSD